MSELNKREIKELCKYFFKCGQEQLNPEMFDKVFENDYKTKLKMRKMLKVVKSGRDEK